MGGSELVLEIGPIQIGLAAAVLLAVGACLWVLWRRSATPAQALAERLDRLEQNEARIERAVREELTKSREEAANSGRHLREEVSTSVVALGNSLVKSSGENAEAQKNQLDSFAKQLLYLTDSNEKRLNDLRGVVDQRLEKLLDESGKKLEAMRVTVDEKLQGTLEKRLGEAFQQVRERLEAVHKGLGEMQDLASGVGDLKRVLSNVKTRGIWGEIQLNGILEQILTTDQYARNVALRPGSSERVDFALRLPGRDSEGASEVWLPIDAKFPQEDYHRLVDAQEKGDAAAAEESARQLEARVKLEAKTIRDKYLHPPETTDFGILFLPVEGLYAEVLRRPGLTEKLQREYQVTVAGPTNLTAILNAFRMGFRTLAIQQRSSEVWKTLGAVKTQFGLFSGLLDKVQNKLQQASNTLEDASKKSRHIERKLKGVEELPSGEAEGLLPLGEGAESDEFELR